MINKYIDLQINGYKGVDFSSASLSHASCAHAFREIIKSQTVLFLPTIITNPIELLERNLNILSDVASLPEFTNHVPGIHLEGPFFSDSEAIGAHNPKYVRKADINILKRLINASERKIRLITVGADVPEIAKLIEFSCSEGIKVSLGHHMANYEQIKLAAQAGASILTHLGNGIPNMVHRHNNPIWGALAVDELKLMIVADGHHLPLEVIKVFIKIKGIKNTMVVSDAAPLAGLPPGKYKTLGNNVILREDGKLFNPEKECLVGSSATMANCIDFLSRTGKFTEDELYKLGYSNQLGILNPEIAVESQLLS
ncbi:MAG TPA: N-acetylglucosamine-6-phosphate deacetylase [Lentisphaeria bacterium]|nr:MAG: hypothetical protein A2X47_02935 [Lentisphaerae bacterium GWF2_38_69]HBM15362.1 N-acetylglucosamine-6-phosphate deacetylase [Lentisphaeria bacterium]